MQTKWIRKAAFLALGLVLAGAIWFSIRMYRIDRGFGDALGMARLLSYYAMDHGGKLPSSQDALFIDGYCSLDDKTHWRVLPRIGKGSASDAGLASDTVRHPERFDVAWGVLPTEIDAEGMVVSRGQHLLRPASNSDAQHLKAPCDMASRLLAEAMLRQAKAVANCIRDGGFGSGCCTAPASQVSESRPERERRERAIKGDLAE